MTSRTSLASWQKLTAHAEEMKQQHMVDLFANDSERFSKFSIKTPTFLFDYSKNLMSDNTFSLLLDLVKDCEIEEWRTKMFSGERINKTEDRAVLHTALRDRANKAITVDGDNVIEDVQKALNHVKAFTDKVRYGEWLGYSGQCITDVVSIGVGGSNLGPEMVTEALSEYGSKDIQMHYVSNVDGTQIANVLRYLNPETTLFIISSKTFTTSETMTNATTAMQWLVAAAFDKNAIAKHFVAVSSNKEKATAFGIEEANIFDMWDWVGGRFSLWSTIGLPIAIDLGFDNFITLLDGANELDTHFCNAPLESNAPVIMALLSVWNTTFLGSQSQVILPYDQSLHRLPAYLQQAEMESNGKSVSWDGERISYTTVPALWGEIGINGQHAFYQYLHQGNTIVPADFIGSVESLIPVNDHHDILMSNFFAQTQALMQGVTEEQVREDLTAKGMSAEEIDKVAPHKVHVGNRPSNTILMQKLTPKTLGSLIALYEQKIFVQGIILQICSFDQWGVELGKGLANKVYAELSADSLSDSLDSSTKGLLDFYKSAK